MIELDTNRMFLAEKRNETTENSVAAKEAEEILDLVGSNCMAAVERGKKETVVAKYKADSPTLSAYLIAKELRKLMQKRYPRLRLTKRQDFTGRTAIVVQWSPDKV